MKISDWRVANKGSCICALPPPKIGGFDRREFRLTGEVEDRRIRLTKLFSLNLSSCPSAPSKANKRGKILVLLFNVLAVNDICIILRKANNTIETNDCSF